MREVKFKFYDTYKKTMFTTDEMNDYEVWGCIKSDRFKCNQYTGLKDKNGVEIYEGDIVIMHTEWAGGYNSDEFGEHENIGVASIVPSKGVMLNRCKKRDIIECEEGWEKTWSVNIRGYRSKVIGNIYENPELLKGDL